MKSDNPPILPFNVQASPIDLYDIPHPSSPMWFTVRRAIERHRNDERPPVSI